MDDTHFSFAIFDAIVQFVCQLGHNTIWALPRVPELFRTFRLPGWVKQVNKIAFLELSDRCLTVVKPFVANMRLA
jgi:hypothetical protein